MAVNFMDRYFSADAAAKAATVQEPPRIPRRGVSMDDAVMRDMSSSNRDSTLVGLILGHETRMQQAQDLYRAGKDAEADAIIDNEDATIEANRQGMYRLGSMRDGVNPEVNRVYGIARSMNSRKYYDARIRRASDGEDGQEFTIGQLRSRRADEIKTAGIDGYGFRKSASDGYFGKSVFESEFDGGQSGLESFKDMVKSCNRMFIDPEIKAGSPAQPSQLRQQRISGCDFVNANAKRLYDTFGAEGSKDFVRTVISRSKEAGGMDKVMSGLLDLYESRKSDGQTVTGRDAADGFFDAIVSVNGPDMSDAEFRNSAMGALEAVKASNKTFDFSDPVAMRAFGLGVSILARGYADGYNLLKLGDDRGKKIQSYLGNFIATVNETGEIPQNNPLSSLYSFHNRLMQVVTPDGNPLSEPEPTGSVKAYRKPEATGAGNVAKGFMSSLEREIAPHLVPGLSDREAFDKVRFDLDGAAMRVASRVARDMGVDVGTARVLTTKMFSYLGDTSKARGPINIEGLVNDMALTDKVAKAWYVANVSDRKRYAKEEAETREHLMSQMGGAMTAQQAEARIASLRLDADASLRRGEDPRQTVWGSERRRGFYVKPTGRYIKFSQKGGMASGKVGSDGSVPAGAIREYQYERGNFDDAEFSYRGMPFKKGRYSEDPAEFRRVQKEMYLDMKKSEDTLRAWAGKAKEDQADDGSYQTE